MCIHIVFIYCVLYIVLFYAYLYAHVCIYIYCINICVHVFVYIHMYIQHGRTALWHALEAQAPIEVVRLLSQAGSQVAYVFVILIAHYIMHIIFYNIRILYIHDMHCMYYTYIRLLFLFYIHYTY